MCIDYARCIGCRACEAACRECGDHGQIERVFVDVVRRDQSLQTVPMICMHCKDPACATACPTQAIQISPEGLVLSADQARCIACENCAVACPFGIPKVDQEARLMVKCDWCYERFTHGLPPMCASVCPSEALSFIEVEDPGQLPQRRLTNRWRMGEATVETGTWVAVATTPDYFAGNHGAERGER